MIRTRQRKKQEKGFTLTEIVIVIAAAALMTLGIGVFLADGQRGWNRLFSRVYGDTTVDGFAACRVFDAVCRKASVRKCVIGPDGDTLELYYWDSESSAAAPEKYAQFYHEEETLYIRHGNLHAGTWQPNTATASTPIRIAGQVASVKFDTNGTSVQMFLTYADEVAATVIFSAVRHND